MYATTHLPFKMIATENREIKRSENEEKVAVCFNEVQRENLSFGPINS